MATVHALNIVVPPTSTAYTAPSAPSTSRLAPPHPSGHRALLPVGQAYATHLRLALHHAHSFSSLDKHLEKERERLAALHSADNKPEDDLGVGSEEEPDELLRRDPKEWKSQDHYAVLGLSHLRYLATPEQIKLANRKKVLKHHPDKKAASGGKEDTTASKFLTGVNLNTNDDAFFKCIAKAHEVLTNPERRRQFDSVDPVFLEMEEDIPTAAEFKVRLCLLLSHHNADLRRASGSISSRRSRLPSSSIPASRKRSLSPRSAHRTPPRQRSRGSTTSGTTLTAGARSSGSTRR